MLPNCTAIFANPLYNAADASFLSSAATSAGTATSATTLLRREVKQVNALSIVTTGISACSGWDGSGRCRCSGRGRRFLLL